MTGSQRDTPSQRPGQPKTKSAIFFVLLGFVVCGLCLPLLYYSSQLNFLMQQHNVPGPGITDLWRTAVGGLLYQVFRHGIITISRPWHDSLCKEKVDIVRRERYIERSCEGTSKACFHLFSCIWGWTVLR